MKEVVGFLQENPVQFLATVGRDGKAKCRPFMFALEQEGKLWFCTNNQKDVYKDMQENPYIEVSVSSSQYAWIRLSGKATFEDHMEVKKACIEGIPLVKKIYKTADNPIFEVFYLADAKAVLADFTGNPPKKYTL
jgi:uncharacterized pyridoxamine 5'-phosphate oxidase family protein